MIRTSSAALVCALMICSVFVAVNASAGGSETGLFPDRSFSIDNLDVWPADVASYITTVSPSVDGDWWAELTSFTGSRVVVQVYDGVSMSKKPLSSTDLRMVGDESKKTPMAEGGLYAVAFTCYGKKAAATLTEHFEPWSFQYLLHAPILIQSDDEFTAENGVTGGLGTESDPFIIMGWSIDATCASGAGIEVLGTEAYFVIRKVEIYNGTALAQNDGIRLSGNLHALAVEDSVITYNHNGITASECPGVLISDNSVSANGGAGIEIMESPGASVTGNEVSSSGDYGLVALDSPGLTMQSNIFSLGFDGVSIRRCDGATVDGNSMTGGYHSLAVSDSNGVTISMNTMVGMSPSGGSCLGIWDSDHATVTSNHLIAGLWGFWLAGGSYPIIADNYVAGNRYGIGMHSSLDFYPYVPILGALVSGNTVVDNELAGIWLQTTCQDAVVSDNIVTGNGGNGITIGECDTTLVTGNTVSENLGSGVLIQYLNGYGNVVTGNLLSRNAIGVQLLYSAYPKIYGNDLIDNTVQASQDSQTIGALWDNGPLSGGNYWSDYTGVDGDGDGFGDTPYQIGATGVDRYPRIEPCVPLA